jgi:predicted RNase H-like HicB family nuclease
MNTYRFSVYVTRDVDGWAACCPEFPDCRARGLSYEDAIANLKDLVQVLVEDGLGDDERLPQPKEARFLDVSLSM